MSQCITISFNKTWTELGGEAVNQQGAPEPAGAATWSGTRAARWQQAGGRGVAAAEAKQLKASPAKRLSVMCLGQERATQGGLTVMEASQIA